MPWEKAFNENKATEAAMHLFWEKGYKDTSMADLLEVTGLTKGSFYNAFGSKHDLFIATLLKYDVENRRIKLQELIAMDSPVESIKTFLNAIMQDTIKDDCKKGCFLVNTAIELNSHSEEIKKIVVNGLGEVETFFKQMIELGQMRKDIPNTVDPQSASKALMGAVVSIRVLGRSVYDKNSLIAITEQSMKLIQ